MCIITASHRFSSVSVLVTRGPPGSGAGIGEKLNQHAVRDPPVDDVCARHAAFDRAQARLDLGNHAGLQRGQQLAQRHDIYFAYQRMRVGPTRIDSFDVGQHEQLFGMQRLRQRRGGAIGVDVIDHTRRIGGNG